MSIKAGHRSNVTCHQHTPSRRKQKGFDLVQIAIVIGVIGILMAAAFMGVPAIMASVRATGEARDLQSYVMRQQQDISAAEISNTTVVAAGHYNESNVDPNTNKIVNRFGGEVIIESAVGQGRFTVTSKSVPYRACEKLIPIIAPAFEKIEVGGVEVKSPSKPLLATPAIVKACAGADQDGNSTGTVEIKYTAPR